MYSFAERAERFLEKEEQSKARLDFNGKDVVSKCENVLARIEEMLASLVSAGKAKFDRKSYEAEISYLDQSKIITLQGAEIKIGSICVVVSPSEKLGDNLVLEISRTPSTPHTHHYLKIMFEKNGMTVLEGRGSGVISFLDFERILGDTFFGPDV
ncbi:hypothetical protein ISD62_03430 [Pseudomonas aeruginosa]|nr:hypothetical protein [Pseudomonas aeruginosa]